MTKKNSIKRTQKKITDDFSDKVLPQNIIEFGEHTQDDKKVYISQQTYKEIHRFTKDKTTNESGGILLGNVIEEFGKTHIVIRAFIEAKYCEGTPTTLKFTHETWEYIHKEADKKYPDYKILGWIHTHPDFGIFLSEYDKFIQENFFKGENQIAYVVDPIQNIEGFYIWVNEKIERCKGFYVFDKTGVKITVSPENDEKNNATAIVESSSPVKNIIIGVLGVAVAFLLIMCLVLNGKVNTLQTQMESLVESANNSIYSMSLQMNSLYSQITDLEARIKALEPETESTDETESNAVEGTEMESSEIETTQEPSTDATTSIIPDATAEPSSEEITGSGEVNE